MEVVIPEELLNRLLTLSWEDVRQGVWVYQLGDPHPFHVGTSVNPLARLTEHRRNSTKDTAGKLSSTSTMRLLDLVRPEDRLRAEAHYIASQGAQNSNKMEALLPQAASLEDVLEKTLKKCNLP